VEKVMGSFRQAHHIINKTSCFGVDYQPATPAPAQHHGKIKGFIISFNDPFKQ
jgi:hypothetical protein